MATWLKIFAMPPWLATNTARKEAWNIGVWLDATRKQIGVLCRRPEHRTR